MHSLYPKDFHYKCVYGHLNTDYKENSFVTYLSNRYFSSLVRHNPHAQVLFRVIVFCAVCEQNEDTSIPRFLSVSLCLLRKEFNEY